MRKKLIIKDLVVRIPRYQVRIQQPHLHQHTSLIPVHVLGGEFPRAKRSREHEADAHVAVRRLDTRQEPGDFMRVREREEDFVDDAV